MIGGTLESAASSALFVLFVADRSAADSLELDLRKLPAKIGEHVKVLLSFAFFLLSYNCASMPL